MSSIHLTDKQFKELKEVLASYFRAITLGGITQVNKEHEAKNVFLLDSAGFSQYEIERILGIDQSAVSRILTGKTKKKGRVATKKAAKE
jgi:hypothetical protein